MPKCIICGKEIDYTYGNSNLIGMYCKECAVENGYTTEQMIEKDYQHIEHKSQENAQNDKLQLLFLITDKDNKIVLDSQRKPTIYRDKNQLKKYRYKFKDTDKICIYKLETEINFDDYFKQQAKEELENENIC